MLCALQVKGIALHALELTNYQICEVPTRSPNIFLIISNWGVNWSHLKPFHCKVIKLNGKHIK